MKVIAQGYQTSIVGVMPGVARKGFQLFLVRKQVSEADTREIVCLDLLTERGRAEFYVTKDDMKQIAAELLRLSEMPP